MFVFHIHQEDSRKKKKNHRKSPKSSAVVHCKVKFFKAGKLTHLKCGSDVYSRNKSNVDEGEFLSSIFCCTYIFLKYFNNLLKIFLTISYPVNFH